MPALRLYAVRGLRAGLVAGVGNSLLRVAALPRYSHQSLAQAVEVPGPRHRLFVRRLRRRNAPDARAQTDQQWTHPIGGPERLRLAHVEYGGGEFLVAA